MYNVSEQYITQIKNPLRNASYLKVEFILTDPDAINASTLTDNGHLAISNLNKTELGYKVTSRYSTLERNIIMLDGTSNVIPTSYSPVYQGFVGDLISNDVGQWTSQPTISVNFGTIFSFAGITLSFDTVTGEYPKELQFKVYENTTLVKTKTVYPTKADNCRFDFSITNCTKLEIVAVKSAVPHRRFRLEELIFGIKKVFDETQITTATFKNSIDLIDSKLPDVTFDFTVIDLDREYNPENPSGVYSFLEQGQEAKIEIGYELDNGKIEWQPMATMFTTGEVIANSQSSISTVQFKTESILSLLSKTFSEGVCDGIPRTLLQLATQILESANLPADKEDKERWSLDTYMLGSISTVSPLPVDTCRNLLQLIANAGRCVLNIDRNGYITISQHVPSFSKFNYRFDDMYSPPTIKKYPILQGVDTKAFKYKPEVETSELAKITIANTAPTDYEFTYELASGVTATVAGGLSIIGTPKFYARKCKITINGNGDLTLTGHKVAVTEETVSVDINPVGERCKVQNELINDGYIASLYADWIAQYLHLRNEYSFKDRGFPEIDVGDDVSLDTIFTQELPATVISSEIVYNGTISGSVKAIGGL